MRRQVLSRGSYSCGYTASKYASLGTFADGQAVV